MQLLNEYHSFVGLQKDLNTLKHSPNFLYDARNIRLTAREDSTMYAITNEKGTKILHTLEGDFIGDCKLGKYLVVFTHSSNSDYIYRIDLSKDNPTVFLLYKGNINLDTEHPIEAIGNYETDSIQKVYWVDGKNPVRFINIEVKYKYDTLHSFDFVPPMKLEEEVEVYKSFGSGEFPSGVIQYAFTYFNENGHESNIFYTTPLQYISYQGRAGSPEEKIANTFKLKISNIEGENFKYIRVYSILRTSINSTPIVKRVQDIEIPAAYKKAKTNWESNKDYTLYNNLEVSIDGGYSFRNIDNLESFALDIKNVSEPSNAKDATITGTYYTPEGKENKVNKTVSELWNEMVSAKGTKVYHFVSEQYPRLIVKTHDHIKSGDEIVNADSYKIINSDKNTELYILRNDSLGVLVVTCVGGKIGGKMVYCSLSDDNNNYKTVTCIDPGTIGDIIDPTELLYKGGEQLIASSITSLDNTLFLGNIKSTMTKPQIGDSYSNYSVSCVLGERNYFIKNKDQDFSYIDILNSVNENTPYCGATCFKQNEYYRLGIQVQHESGKWSEPIYLTDHKYSHNKNNGTLYSLTEGKIKVPEFEWKLGSGKTDTLVNKLISQGYKRIRPVFALSSGFEGRTIICQGVVCPTVYRDSDRYLNGENSTLGNIYAQSSWLFRSSKTDAQPEDKGGKVSYGNEEPLSSHYTIGPDMDPNLHMYNTEIMGIIEPFKVDCNFITLHSPDIIHDSNLYSIDYTGVTLHTLGYAEIKNTYGSIKMQTSSPPIGTSSSGDISKSIKTGGESALVSGLWYQDNIVADISSTPTYGPLESSNGYKWLVSMWHKKGSFNNDVNREGRSAEISKKVISNYRLCNNTSYPYANGDYDNLSIDIFNDDQLSLVKVGGKPYLGNIETMIYPTESSPYYLSDSSNESLEYRLWSIGDYNGLQKIDGDNWYDENGDLGDNVKNIVTWREGISMKYKSTPHMVVMLGPNTTLGSEITISGNKISGLIMADVIKPHDTNTFFGGTSEDALKSNLWIPCGPPVNLKEGESITLNYKWGDTYYGRYECLKTYPFTREDPNQVVEIASFTVESRVNIAGRYDRNRGQIDNTNMSPENFNLINKVYSQPDNFFSYRILDDSFYREDKFPNQIIWSLVKTPGEEVDTWTSISSASTYSLDGSKGEIIALKTWKDSIYCFQDNGISNVLYNSRIQVPTSDGVPIEISNSNKLEGHRYITDGYGCVNKDNIKVCNSGIYFIDSTTNHLLYIGDGIKDISTSNGFSSWFNNNDINSIQYDPKHSDIYLVGENGALCFSETLGQFISIFDYDNIVSLSSYRDSVFSIRNNKLYKMFSGKYNEFFGDKKPWGFTFITNGLGQNQQTKDKIFSNIEYRIEEYNSGNKLQDSAMTNLIVEDSYQSTGECILTKSNTKSVVFNPKDSNIQKKKFKIWRIQIPRDSTYKLDRIRDTWCKITLSNDGNNDNKSILFDLNVQYYV